MDNVTRERFARSIKIMQDAFPLVVRETRPDLTWHRTDRSDLRCTGMDGELHCHLIVNHPQSHHG